MSDIERYIAAVMRHIVAPPAERQRIENDLWAHFQEGIKAGKPAGELLANMGKPEEVAAAFMANIHLHYASFWIRLGAFIIDIVIILVVAGIAAGLAVVAANFVPQNLAGSGDYAIGIVMIVLTFGLGLLALAVVILYFPLQEGRWGKTVGKQLMGIHVLTEDGMPIGYKEAIIRRISFYLGSAVFFIDALFVPFTDLHQRGFDIIAKTIVVQNK